MSGLTLRPGRSRPVVMIAALSLLAPAQLASQHLPRSGELGRRVLAHDSTTATTSPKLIRWTRTKSPGRAQALSLAGTLELRGPRKLVHGPGKRAKATSQAAVARKRGAAVGFRQEEIPDFLRPSSPATFLSSIAIITIVLPLAKGTGTLGPSDLQ